MVLPSFRNRRSPNLVLLLCQKSLRFSILLLGMVMFCDSAVLAAQEAEAAERLEPENIERLVFPSVRTTGISYHMQPRKTWPRLLLNQQHHIKVLTGP